MRWPSVEVRLYGRSVPGVGEFTGCLEYQGARHRKGHGYFCFNGKRTYAHRVSFFLANGTWPKLFVIHSCDNPPCVNPAHLREGTHMDNMRDMVKRGRNWNPGAHKTSCPNGHEYSAGNTGIRTTGGRYCRSCQRLWTIRWRLNGKRKKLPRQLESPAK